jgi:hypothetical protein
MAALASSRRRKPSYCRRSAAVRSFGSTLVAPIAIRMGRIRLAHRIEQGCAGVLHEMPSVGNLDCMRQRQCSSLTISAATIARQNLDRLMACQERRYRGSVSVWQKLDNPMPFKIAHDGAITTVAPKRPIINAHDCQPLAWRPGTAAHHTEQCIIADRQHQSLGETCRRASTQGNSEVMYEIFQPGSSARSARQDIITETLLT